MSDGPHKSLKIKPWWKKLVERANMDAASPEEVRELLQEALMRELKERQSCIYEIRDVIEDQQTYLFNGLPEKLEELQLNTAASSYERVIVECVLRNQATGSVGLDDLLEVSVSEALEVINSRSLRQIEEHCKRATDIGRAFNIRNRLAKAATETDYGAIVNSVLDGSDRHPRKQDGLDDGVEI